MHIKQKILQLIISIIWKDVSIVIKGNKLDFTTKEYVRYIESPHDGGYILIKWNK